MTEESIVHDAEWSLIDDTEVRGEGNEAVTNLAKQVLNGEYITIFNSDFARRILRTDDTSANFVGQS